MRVEVESIGRVESPRKQAEDDYWGGEESCILLADRFGDDALQGLEEFSHAEVLFHFDQVEPARIVSGARHPRNNPDWPAVGIFAQRGKNRPNRIGSTICRLLRRDGRRLHVAELDAIDGTRYDLDLGGRILWVIDLFVTPTAREKGASLSLMHAAAQICRDSGGSHLSWSVFPPNKLGRRFYEHLGARHTEHAHFMHWRISER